MWILAVWRQHDFGAPTLQIFRAETSDLACWQPVWHCVLRDGDPFLVKIVPEMQALGSGTELSATAYQLVRPIRIVNKIGQFAGEVALLLVKNSVTLFGVTHIAVLAQIPNTNTRLGERVAAKFSQSIPAGASTSLRIGFSQ